ncbi:hypothetical protein tinsulaeT_14020 [Thalassotalea insulae]|uniref:DUF4097 domain-containing protein n=2 Tax=Thalassotalea insulae TaxID=2056778 RepID=A0ABQ6GTS5_9GAMM|nr:hypothetical protein tinsulaeT_14020 [Thalassotalea insulae]
MKKFVKLGVVVLTTMMFGTCAAQQVHKSLPSEGVTSVSVENQQGKVTVTAWEKDSVEVDGEITDKAEKFVFERSGDRIIIKVVLPDYGHKGHRREHDSIFTVKLPSSMRFDFAGIASDISLTGLAKNSEVETVSGNIDAKNLSDYIDISTVSGNIVSQGLAGKIRLATVSGDIKDQQSDGQLDLKAVSGNINTRSTAKELRINNVSGDIDFSLADVDELKVSTVSGEVEGQLALNENGLLKMSSVSGDFNIAFTNEVQANFKMSANAGGQLINRITNDKAQHAKYGPSAKLRFTTGNGSASVKATTVSGRIVVRED